MPIQVTCEACGVTLSTPDSSAGKRGKCPKCASPIEIPAAPVPEPQEDDEVDAFASPFGGLSEEEMTSGEVQENERKPCPACGEMIMRQAIKCRYCGEIFDKSMASVLGSSSDFSDPAWEKVHAGVSNIYYGIVVMFAAIVGMVIVGMLVGGLAAAQGGDPGEKLDEMGGVFIAIFAIGGISIFVAGIMMLVGYVRCTNVPKETGAYGFATGTIVCMVGNFFLSMCGSGLQAGAVQGLGSLLSMIGNVLFMLFIRKTAQYLNNEELASSALRFLIFGVVMFCGGIILGVLMAVIQEGGVSTMIAGIFGLAIIVGGIVAFIWYMRLLKSLQTTIADRAGLN